MTKSRFKKIILVASIILCIIFLAGLYFLLTISSFIKEPFKTPAPEKTIAILSGQNFKSIAEQLKAEDIISSSFYFAVYAKFKKSGKKIQAGEYLLSASKTPEEILDMFIKGKVKIYRLTIPEGLNIKEIAALIEKENLCGKEKFISLCYNPELLKKLGVEADSLEGYLFPDTYFFSKPHSCEDIILSIFERFKSVFTDEWRQRSKEIEFSVHQILTLASLIEKETGNASERPVISSVFHNRLGKNMRLESDPTVIYGIENFDGNIKKIHLQTATPYNTYQISGLPPGPIASPGALSIQAALYPVQTRYLYFVSKNDTTHHFSETFEEHTKAVTRYQLKK